jgi:NAD(P) transhydrogenase
MHRYDVVVLGGGPAGERAAVQAARIGKRVALIEREHVVGGTCVNWGTIPSKTLRESAVFVQGLTTRKLEGIRCALPDGITMADFMHRERVVVQRELELINRILDRYAIEVIEGHGRFADPHTVVVAGRDGRERLRVQGDIFVIATGTRPNRPPDIHFDGQTVFDSGSILRLARLPESMVVLGAGVIGVEYASIFGALGIQVTLVDTRSQLLPYLDREIADLLQRSLRKLRIALIQGDHYAQVEGMLGQRPMVRCRTQNGNILEADILLYCVGRDGNTDGIGLEEIGLRPTARGLLEVNGLFQTAHPHIYAVGDVIGYPALASTSAEQGRQAIRHAFQVPGPRGSTEMLPFAIYAIPEVSFIGATEEELRQAGVDYVAGHGRYELNPRGQILGDTDGVLKILCETESLRLRGVHVIGTGASELVHTGQAFLRNQADAWQLAETMYNYPTLSDLYRHAALKAIAARRDKRGQ